MLIVFSIPTVQTFVARKITDSLKESKDVDIWIGRVGLTYSGKLNLDEVLVLDHHLDTLIYSRNIQTSVTSVSSVYNNNPTLGSTTAQQLYMYMKVYEGEERDNLNVFLNKLKTQKQQDPAPFLMEIDRLEVINGAYSYINHNLNYPEVIVVEDLNINAKDFLLENSDVYVDIQKFSGYERRGIRIEGLSTLFSYTSEEMSLETLKIETPGSFVDADIRFDITNGFAGFIDKVPVQAVFRPSTISTNDLQPFYENFGNDREISFSTTLTGILNDFHLADLEMHGLDRTRLEGDLQIRNSLSAVENEFSLNGTVSNLSTNYYDLVNLLPGLLQDKLPVQLREFGNVRLEGSIFVSENALTTKSKLFSQLGTADVDLRMNDFSGSATAYKGRLRVNNFNVGRIANVNSIGNTSFNITFDGRGFSQETLDTQVQGTVSKFVYNNYAYNNLKIRGTLRAPLLSLIHI